MIDFNTKQKISVKNILVLKMSYKNIYGDDKNRLNMQNIGSGVGKYISDGKSRDITWEKDFRGGKTTYFNEDKTKLKINDGNTYIEFIPDERDLIIE